MSRPSKINPGNVTGFDEDEAIREELKSLGADGSGATVSGRIYRKLPPDNERGIAQPTEFCGPVDRFVDEDYVGKKYGPGHYKLRFIVTYSDGTKKTTDKHYDVGGEYAKYKPADVPAPQQVQEQAANAPKSPVSFLSGFLGGMTAKELMEWGMAFKTIKEIFAPAPAPKSEPDYLKLFELINANKAPNISDAVVIKAMENMNAQTRAASPFQQMKELLQMQELLRKEEPENHDEGEEMNTILKMALEYLPTLLKNNNNNYKAAGQQAAAFPMVRDMVRNNPGLAQEFFKTAVNQYGEQNALQLAAGFGFAPVSPNQAAAAVGAQNQQLANNQEEPGELDDLPDEYNEGGENG